MKEKDLVLVEALDFGVRDNVIVCYIEGHSVLSDDFFLPNFFSVVFQISENSDIQWLVSYTDQDSHISKTFKFQIYDIKKTKIRNTDIKHEDFWLNFYTNKKGDKFFLSLETGNTKNIKKDVKDITSMKIGDEIEFKLQGDIFILSFTVKIVP